MYIMELSAWGEGRSKLVLMSILASIKRTCYDLVGLELRAMKEISLMIG